MEELLKYNTQFVRNKGYEPYITTKYPDKKIAILTCMDTRLTTLLPAALGLKNGDVKMIKNAGGIITDPFDSVMRSLLVGVFELGVEEILVIAHSDCGACNLSSKEMLEGMRLRGIDAHDIDLIKFCGVNFDTWLEGFKDTPQSVRNTVSLIKRHPLIPSDIKVYGFIMDSTTGELSAVC